MLIPFLCWNCILFIWYALGEKKNLKLILNKESFGNFFISELISFLKLVIHHIWWIKNKLFEVHLTPV